MAARRRFILTGTPILNNLLDIFGQYKILDPKVFGQNFWSFRLRYFYDKNANMPAHIRFPDWRPRPNAEQEIGELIAASSVQAKKEECIDLPELHKIDVPVSMSERQAEEYEKMAKHFVAECNGTTTLAEIAMTKTLRLMQILAGFVANDERTEWFDDVPRIDALSDLLESIGDQKTIVWTTFRPTYQRIADVCKTLKRSYAFLTGNETSIEQQKSIEDFCRGNVNTLIANPKSGGAGINLTEAGYAIYYTKNYSLEEYVQSEGRNYRGGSSDLFKSVSHYHMYSEGTIDEVISKALLNKMDIGEAVLSWARDKKITIDTARSNCYADPKENAL